MIDLVESACGAKNELQGFEQGASLVKCQRCTDYTTHSDLCQCAYFGLYSTTSRRNFPGCQQKVLYSIFSQIRTFFELVQGPCVGHAR